MVSEKWFLVSCAWWLAAGVSTHDISVNHRHSAPVYYYWQKRPSAIHHPFSFPLSTLYPPHYPLPITIQKSTFCVLLVNYNTRCVGWRRNRFKRHTHSTDVIWFHGATCNRSLTVMSEDYVQVRPAPYEIENVGVVSGNSHSPKTGR